MPLPRTLFTFTGANGKPLRCWLSISDRLVAVAQPLEKCIGCCGCTGKDAPEIVTWLGVRWIGTPWPRRIRRDADRRGCGCPLKLKALAWVLSLIMRTAVAHLRAWRAI